MAALGKGSPGDCVSRPRNRDERVAMPLSVRARTLPLVVVCASLGIVPRCGLRTHVETADTCDGFLRRRRGIAPCFNPLAHGTDSSPLDIRGRSCAGRRSVTTRSWAISHEGASRRARRRPRRPRGPRAGASHAREPPGRRAWRQIQRSTAPNTARSATSNVSSAATTRAFCRVVGRSWTQNANAKNQR